MVKVGNFHMKNVAKKILPITITWTIYIWCTIWRQKWVIQNGFLQVLFCKLFTYILWSFSSFLRRKDVDLKQSSYVLHFYYTACQRLGTSGLRLENALDFIQDHHRMLMKVYWKSDIFVKLFIFRKKKSGEKKRSWPTSILAFFK